MILFCTNPSIDTYPNTLMSENNGSHFADASRITGPFWCKPHHWLCIFSWLIYVSYGLDELPEDLCDLAHLVRKGDSKSTLAKITVENVCKFASSSVQSGNCSHSDDKIKSGIHTQQVLGGVIFHGMHSMVKNCYICILNIIFRHGLAKIGKNSHFYVTLTTWHKWVNWQK